MLLSMSLSGLFIVISGMGGMTACSDAIGTARSSEACINLVAIGGEADKAGPPSDVRSGATNPLLKSLALLAFWLCLKNGQRSPPSSLVSRALALHTCRLLSNPCGV